MKTAQKMCCLASSLFFGAWELIGMPLEELRVGTRVKFSIAFNYLGPIAVDINLES